MFIILNTNYCSYLSFKIASTIFFQVISNCKTKFSITDNYNSSIHSQPVRFFHKDCNNSFFILLRFDPSKLPIFSTNLTIRHQEKRDEDIDQGILEDIEDLSDSDDSFDAPIRKNFRLPKSKLKLEEEKILKELDKKRHSISVEEPGNG